MVLGTRVTTAQTTDDSSDNSHSSRADEGQDGDPDKDLNEDGCGGDPPAGGDEPRPKWTRETLSTTASTTSTTPGSAHWCSCITPPSRPSWSTTVRSSPTRTTPHIPRHPSAWKVRTIHDAMSPTFTLQFGVEDAARQACYYYRDLVFPGIEEEEDRYFPHLRGEGPGCKMAKLQHGEGARLEEIVALVVSLNTALDRSMIDQRDLWCEVERLRAKVEEFERRSQEGGQLRDPPPPICTWDNAIISSRKRHHPGCTCTRTIVDP